MAKSEKRKQFLFDAFVTAMEGGIGYWAYASKYHWRKDNEEGLSIDDVDGFYANIQDAECEDAFEPTTINQAVIVKGINKIFKDDELQINQNIRADVINASLKNDAGYLDAESADCIVQVGLFGEIVFG